MALVALACLLLCSGPDASAGGILSEGHIFMIMISIHVSTPPISIRISIRIEPTSDVPRGTRLAQADAAIGVLTPLFNPSNGSIDALNLPQSANLICALALHDYLAGNASHESVATNNLLLFQRTHTGFYDATTSLFAFDADSSVDALPPGQWGLAALYAYRAYDQGYLLDIAKSVWTDTSKAMVTVADAANGSHPSRTLKFEGQCEGATTAGGVFWLVDSPTNTLVNGESVGLSAYLYEATNDSQYAVAAELSAGFVYNHMYNRTIVLDTFDLVECAITPGTGAFTYNSAFWLEGLAVWAAVGNASWWNVVEALAVSTIEFPGWTRSDGINLEDAGTPQDPSSDSFGSGWKGAVRLLASCSENSVVLTYVRPTSRPPPQQAIFVRSLNELRRRLGTSNAPLTALIEGYITVQYNALVDLAAAPGSTVYSSSWIGPPTTQVLAWGQSAAIDVLNAAFVIAPADEATTNTTSSNPGPTPTARVPNDTSSAHASAHTDTGAIAGGIAGGVAGVALLFLCAFCVVRRRRRTQGAPEPEHPYQYRQARTGSVSMGLGAGAVEPFLLARAQEGVAGMRGGKGRRGGEGEEGSSSSTGSGGDGGNASASASGAEDGRGGARDGEDGEGEGEIDVAAIPGLVRRLNGMLARLQGPGLGQGPVGEGEAPPMYEA
ncbi:hypothetical protein OF83DRAFT_1088716 [Amylostereum chailletii]|nr:hypothetical protein OF83DRAFT_1088716 [Amylostereum chailletii]